MVVVGGGGGGNKQTERKKDRTKETKKQSKLQYSHSSQKWGVPIFVFLVKLGPVFNENLRDLQIALIGCNVQSTHTLCFCVHLQKTVNTTLCSKQKLSCIVCERGRVCVRGREGKKNSRASTESTNRKGKDEFPEKTKRAVSLQSRSKHVQLYREIGI